MATISRLSVSLLANTSGLRRGLNKARGMVKKFTGTIANLKTAIVGALGVASLGALIKGSVDLFAKQQQAVAALDASIVSMGRNTKGLSRTIQDLASQIQREGIIGDEALIQGASFLTTYGDITDKLMPRTIRIMADLAAKMGGGEGGVVRAANLLGKASMGLVGALSIAGISLSDAAKESKDFEMILGEIEQQVGGMNKALGATATGSIEKFKNAWGDVLEVLGGVVAVAIEPFLASATLGLGGMGQSMEKINALGEKFRSWLVESAKSFSWIADVRLGFQLLTNVIKQALSGVVLWITTIQRAGMKLLNFMSSWGGLFDNLKIFDSQAMKDVEDSWLRQAGAISKLQDEFNNLKSPLERGVVPSRELEKMIDAFALQAEVDMMMNRLGLTPGGTFRQAAVPTPKTDQSPRTVRDPQLKDTNSILMDIRRDLLISRGAVGAVAG